MRIGLVSDSHGSKDALLNAVDAIGEADLIIHAGDYASDSEWIKEYVGIPVMSVRGNCDFYDESYPEFIDTKVGGHHLLVEHGHRQHVKSGIEDFLIDARAHEADIAVFGHTHIPQIVEIRGVLLVNPGSVSLPHGSNSPSCAVITLDGDRRSAQIIELKDKKRG
ncbi:MAG: metallophosphoesterase family protein [Eubacteriaceae bacterium]|jgi:putative phosphoesterase